MMESSDLPNGHNNQDVDEVVTAIKTVGDSKPESQSPANSETVSSTKMVDQDISEKIPEKSTTNDNESREISEGTNNDAEGLKGKEKSEDTEAGQGDVEISENCKIKTEDVNTENNEDEASFKMEITKSPDGPEDSDCLKIDEGAEGTKKAKDDSSLVEKSEDERNDSLNSENDVSIVVSESTSVSFPDCHTPNVHSAVTDWASNIRKQLDDIIALKTKRDVEMSLSRLRQQLTEFEAAAANKSCPLLYSGSVKKRKVRFGTPTAVIKVMTPENDRPDESPPPPEVDFKSLKGLAVFAKWPNSCWYYPGIVQDLEDLTAWKETLDVTVTFYDGLQRTMKNINILPAALIPIGAILSDLEDETELLVEDKNVIETHLVEFDLKVKPDVEPVKAPFSRLAIRAVHMKKIKILLEPNFDVAPKKMHMVSLDNLVSGRRSRIRPSKDDEEVDSRPRRGTRQSKRKSSGDDDEETDVQEVPVTEAVEISEAEAEELKPTPSKRRAK